MGGEWTAITLGDLGSLKNGANFSSQDYGNDHPVVSVKSLFRGRFVVTDGLDAIKSGVLNKIDNFLLQKNDILFARSSLKRSGSGQSAIVKHVPAGTIFSGFTIRFRLDTNVQADPLFLFYNFQSPQSREQFARIATGTTISNLSQANLGSILVDLPPLFDQRAIAHILGSLDDKIELNRQMNTTLESMAQALFKSWFVDFDPVIDNALAAGNPIPELLQARAETRKALGDKRKPLPEAIQKQFPSGFVFSEEMGWIPEGWNPVKLGAYVTVKRGGSPRPIHDYLVDEGLPWVKISDASASSSRYLMGTKQFIKPEGLKKTVMLKKGELILSNSATPGLPMFLNLDACIHDGWLYFPQKSLFGDLYLYQLFLVVRDELLMQGNGSVFTNLKTDILKNHLVVRPSEPLMKEVEGRLNSIHGRSLLIQEEIASLVAARDVLLPKLLSGQLRIPDAEKIVAGVE